MRVRGGTLVPVAVLRAAAGAARGAEQGAEAGAAKGVEQGAASGVERGAAGEAAAGTKAATPKNGEPPQLRAGKEAHAAEPVRPGEKAEVRTPSGKRMDRYNADKAHIREVKPNNARGRAAGEKQLRGYKTEMDKATGKSHTTELTTYDKKQQ